MAQSGGGLFSFGQSTTPAFGATSGTPATGTAGFGGGFSFGAGAQQQQQPQAAAPAFSFGSTSTAPAGQTGLAFGSGAQQPGQAAPAFGLGAQPAQPTQSTGLSFGATAAPGTTSLFSLSTPSTGTAFGTPAAGTQGSTGFGTGLGTGTGFGTTLGATGTTGFGGSSLGAATGGATTGGFTGFGLGTTATSSAPTTSMAPLSFGTSGMAPTSSTASTGLSFGTPASTAAPTLGSGFTLGATPAQTTGFGTAGGGALGATSTAAPSSGFSFGANTSTAPATSSTLSFGAGSTLGGTATTSAASGFNFGAKLPAIGTTATSTAAPQTTSLFGALGGMTTSAPATTTTGSSVTTLGGLGGVPKHSGSGVESSFAFGGSGDGKAENRALQELPIPQEMLMLVEELKNQIKSEKIKFTEVGKANNDVLISKVTEEFEDTRALAANVVNMIQKQSNSCEALKNLIHEGISNAEMANQTKETPMTSQMEHTTPMRYFFNLIESYRERMHMFLREIEKAESSLSYVISAQTNLTSKELFDALKATQESTIALSAKIQILHEEVAKVAEAHRNFQRYLLGESADLSVPASRSDKHERMPYFKMDESHAYSKPSVLFPHKLVEPPKIGGFHTTQAFSSPVKPSGSMVQGMGFSSTPIVNRIAPQQQQNKPSDSFFYAPHALFQTQQSTMLANTQLGSSTLSPGTSLKRSKNCI